MRKISLAKKLSIVIADDHPMFRKGLSGTIKTIPDIKNVDEAGNGSELLKLMHTKHFDLVFLDIIMPIIDGEEAAKIIHVRYPHVRMIVMSICDDAHSIRRMYMAGCHGYLVKNSDEIEIRHAIKEVSSGNKYYSEFALQQITSIVDKREKISPVRELTQSEMKLVPLICSEKSNREIAKELFLSTRTVEAHRYNIYRKTGAKNLSALIQFAIRNRFF